MSTPAETQPATARQYPTIEHLQADPCPFSFLPMEDDGLYRLRKQRPEGISAVVAYSAHDLLPRRASVLFSPQAGWISRAFPASRALTWPDGRQETVADGADWRSFSLWVRDACRVAPPDGLTAVQAAARLSSASEPPGSGQPSPGHSAPAAAPAAAVPSVEALPAATRASVAGRRLESLWREEARIGELGRDPSDDRLIGMPDPLHVPMRHGYWSNASPDQRRVRALVDGLVVWSLIDGITDAWQRDLADAWLSRLAVIADISRASSASAWRDRLDTWADRTQPIGQATWVLMWDQPFREPGDPRPPGRFWFVGPFRSIEHAEVWRREPGRLDPDNPCWQVLTLPAGALGETPRIYAPEEITDSEPAAEPHRVGAVA